MESTNKNAAEECLKKARSAWLSGDVERAKKFVKKSINLCPSDEAEDFLNKIQMSNGAPPSQQQPRQRTRTQTKEKTEREEQSEEKQYTPEQVNAVKRVLERRDYYEILELQKSASEVEIKKQYRKLALQLHPDKNNAPKADEAFKAVSKAYAVLSDKEKKVHYDQFGEDVGPARGPAYTEREFDADEMFRMFFGDSVFGSGFGSMYTDQFGRRIYRRGSHGRYRHTHGPHSHQSGREPDSGLAMFCQLVPIIILLLVVVFGNALSSLYPMNSYSMQQSNYYPIKRYIKDLNIPYFVQTSFKSEIATKPSLLKSVEKDVISERLWILNQQCNYERYTTRKRGKTRPESCLKYDELQNKLQKFKSR